MSLLRTPTLEVRPRWHRWKPLLLLLLLWLVLSLVPPGDLPSPQLPGLEELRNLPVFGRLPIRFEPNEGQWPVAADYLVRGLGYTLWLNSAEAIAYLPEAGDAPLRALRTRFLGANTNLAPVTLDQLPGVVNYYNGREPGQQFLKLPTFGRVAYRQLYEGIDLVYYAEQNELKYDLIVSPGADPAVIRLEIDGSDELAVAENGDLVLRQGEDQIVHQKPVAYQEVAGRRRPVAAEFVLVDANTVAFRLGAYDGSRPLVIDPTMVEYMTYYGTNASDWVHDIVVDDSGTLHMTGFRQVVVPGGFCERGSLLWVGGLNANASGVPYETIFQVGCFNLFPGGIALGQDGKVYVVASTDSPNLFTTPGAYLDKPAGGLDGFVAKIDPTKFGLAVYLTYLGGPVDDFATAVGVDSNGNAIVGGSTAGQFPIVGNTYQRAYQGGPTDAFVAKMNAAGSNLLRSTYLGGAGSDAAYDMAVNQSGAIAVTGATGSNNFPTVSAYDDSVDGSLDNFVTVFNNQLSNVAYSTYLGGSDNESFSSIAYDDEGNAYVVGQTWSADFPLQDPLVPGASFDTADFFATKLDSGGAPAYSTFLTGHDQSEVTLPFVATDNLGNMYITGRTTDPNLPLKEPIQDKPGGGLDSFIMVLNNDGSARLFSTYFGGVAIDAGRSIVVDEQGDVYVGGGTASPGLPTTPGVIFPNYMGDGLTNDGWALKIPLRVCQNNTAAGTTSISGDVYTQTEQDSWLPLFGARVTVRDECNRILASTRTQEPLGRYTLNNVPKQDDLQIRVDLELVNPVAGQPSIFRVLYGRPTQAGGGVAYVRTPRFSTKAAAAALTRDIVWVDGRNSPALLVDRSIPRGRLDDLAIIYYHTYQAWQLSDLSMSQPLDAQLPIDVVGYASNGVTGWAGPYTDGAGASVDPYLSISAADSDHGDDDAPDNREWHEFGHHVMADTYGNVAPIDPRNINHAGYFNPSTTDSWVEGFAEFYSLLVARDIVGDPRPELYRWGGWESNLESNYLAWEEEENEISGSLAFAEEFAVASLLWDLVDPVDLNDATDFGGSTYADCVELSFSNFLWSLLATDWDNRVPRSPIAVTQGEFGYLFDVKHLYDVLKVSEVGSRHSRDRSFDDLDELFVAHGFFYDADGDFTYDPGEEIGRAADTTDPDRRKRPTIDGSYVNFQANDAGSGQPATVEAFSVDVQFAPPFAHYNYSFETTSAAPGRLFIYGPDSSYEATTTITAHAPGLVSAPLVIDNDFYWQQLAAGTGDSILEHTFEMKEAGVYLPLVLRGAALAAAQANAARPPAAAAHTAVPCSPDEEPTPTATPTPTRDPGAPLVESISPNSVPQGQSVRVTIKGQNFQPGANPFIGSTPLQNVDQPDTETLIGTLPAGLAPGVYDVVVVNPGGKTNKLANGFTVTEGNQPPTSTPTPDSGGSQLVPNGDFEDGAINWTESSTQGRTLIRTEFGTTGVTPHGGQWAVWLGGLLNETDYVEQTVVVPLGTTRLTFYAWLASNETTCGDDYLFIDVDGDLFTYDLCQANNTGGWLRFFINATTYAGQQVTIQIGAVTDGDNNSNFFLDDVAFDKVPVAQTSQGVLVTTRESPQE